jgi:hypothetical protein
LTSSSSPMMVPAAPHRCKSAAKAHVGGGPLEPIWVPAPLRGACCSSGHLPHVPPHITSTARGRKQASGCMHAGPITGQLSPPNQAAAGGPHPPP